MVVSSKAVPNHYRCNTNVNVSCQGYQELLSIIPCHQGDGSNRSWGWEVVNYSYQMGPRRETSLVEFAELQHAHEISYTQKKIDEHKTEWTEAGQSIYNHASSSNSKIWLAGTRWSYKNNQIWKCHNNKPLLGRGHTMWKIWSQWKVILQQQMKRYCSWYVNLSSAIVLYTNITCYMLRLIEEVASLY